jgi:3-deoxy-7-phosphoheptulonate synthase
MKKTNNLRIRNITPLISPVALKRELSMTEKANLTVIKGRKTVESIINKRDGRLLAIVGPCSIHDREGAVEYAERLNSLGSRIADKIVVLMRVYFEKPRTKLGWKGLILDPEMDGSSDIAMGLRTARKLLIDINELGLPTGSEMLEPIIPQYIADLVSWAAIGARTTESQTHREMASGLSMPVGFKNATDGSLDAAVNACGSAVRPHNFIGIDQEGRTCVFSTTGNQAGHLILRGGKDGPNYYEESVERAEFLLEKANLNDGVIIDCSHGNSGKDPHKQARVLRSILQQKNSGRSSIRGFMLESNLVGGSQDIPGLEGPKIDLIYGQSITDACIGWDETEEVLLEAYKTFDIK